MYQSIIDQIIGIIGSLFSEGFTLSLKRLQTSKQCRTCICVPRSNPCNSPKAAFLKVAFYQRCNSRKPSNYPSRHLFILKELKLSDDWNTNCWVGEEQRPVSPPCCPGNTSWHRDLTPVQAGPAVRPLISSRVTLGLAGLPGSLGTQLVYCDYQINRAS